MSIDLASYSAVHFVGIGGIGMSALARMLLHEGYIVSGSDASVSEQTVALAQQGATVWPEHDASHVGDAGLVVTSSAVAADNPEVTWAQANGRRVVKRAELLAAIMNPRYGVAVAGTHGKTTTSALLGHLLIAAGLDPTILIGGVSQTLGSNARVGSGLQVVVEADEYDASFLHLRPRAAIITNIEADHLDFYGSIQEITAAFESFGSSVTDVLVLNADDPILSDLRFQAARQIYCGLNSGDWQATDIVEGRADTTFRVSGQAGMWRTLLGGPHNVLNAVMALAMAHALGVPDSVAREALAEFTGVQRRLEVKGEVGGVTVIDDYAHHPTEIRADLAALRNRYRRPIRVIFQPHTYSRTQSFLDEFAQAFGDASAVYVLPIYAARERDTLGISSDVLVNKALKHHSDIRAVDSSDAAVESVRRDARPEDIVVTMGAGDVYRLAPSLLQALNTR